jgi:aryl-alcohol dehydrogenase-like predicted oxidoreductase
LRALGVDTIDLYQFHRPDPSVPYADSVGALRELREAGKVRTWGFRTPASTRSGRRVEILGGGLVSVQNQFLDRTSGRRKPSCGGARRWARARSGVPFLYYQLV